MEELVLQLVQRPLPLVLGLLSLVWGLSACDQAASSSPSTLRLGAVFPLHGPQSSSATEELRGVKIAAELANSDGGVKGRHIELDVRDLETREQAPTAIGSLHDDGVPLVLGAYSSQLSIPAAAAASSSRLVYWEAGAVADRLTGEGSPWVFRVGATGSNLGDNSARFAATQLVPRLGLTPSQTRVAVVWENDAYGQSVADGAMTTAQASGLDVVDRISYDAYKPDWPSVLGRVAAARPDVLVLASYIPDGEAFRRAMLAEHVHVGAMIGSSMAECMSDFGDDLGPQAVGVFASDRPGGGFNPGALGPTGGRDYQRFAAAWKAQTGQATPDNEGLAGFSAAWALFHYVLPQARSFSASAIAAAARQTTLAAGVLPNGAGLHFAEDRAHEGQNLLAAAVIWQWQAVRHSVVVWPPTYATGAPAMVPLPA
jgi:branched-chain amino acid transport system substrate-binding protein